MLDTFSMANAADFKARYVNCFGWFINKENKEIPVFLDKIRETTLFFSGMDGVPYHTYADAGVQFKFASIRKAIYQGLDGKLYCLQRHPARQWRRGICADNTVMYELTEKGRSAKHITLDSMANILNADQSKRSKHILSDMFAIVGSSVFIYDTKIGGFDPETGTITLAAKMQVFLQDVMDACRNNGLTYKVK